MKIQEAREMAIRIPELRKKELTTRLTISEQQELASMIEIQKKTYPENTEHQYAENVKLTAIRNFTFKEVTPKASLMQKLLKKEILKEYEIKVVNASDDVVEYNLHFTLGLEIRQLMEDVGLALDWPKMLPVDFSLAYTDILEEDEKNWFTTFPDPAWCSLKLNEAKSLEEKVNARSNEIGQLTQWLRTHWEAGYQIYADIDPYNDDELD